MEPLQNKELVSIINHFMRVFRKYHLIVKKAVDVHSDEKLHARELETIISVGMNPEIRSARLGSLMGISKGAVSQVVNRLLRKQYLAKYPDPESQKSFLLRLSDKGSTVFQDLMNQKENILQEYLNLYRDARPSEVEMVRRVLETIEQTFDRILADNKHIYPF